jgi:hypothetical protein
MKRALLCLLALNTSVLAAQAPTLVGSWQVSYPAGVRNENGNVTVLHGTGVLTIVAQGDSLIGSLAADPNPDFTPRPPSRLAGRAASAEATFISHSEATLSMNGDERTATVVSTWKFRVQGDSLLGTVERKLEGFDLEGGSQPPQPVTGVRRKG